MNGLTQAPAPELGLLVRVNAVCPGQIGTRMMGRVLSDPAYRLALEAQIAAARFAEPREVMEVIAWLLSDRASYINGAIRPVDGSEPAGLRQERKVE